MDPKGHIVLDKYPGEWEAMPSYIEEPEAAACKWVSIRERNREKFDLPTVFSISIYVSGDWLSPGDLRRLLSHGDATGASAAVSAKWMARKSSKKLAIVGAGHMAAGTLATCDTVFAWDEVRVWSRSQLTLDEFTATQGPKYPRFKIRASRNLEEVVRGADVVVTVTPAREPLVKDEWISPGTLSRRSAPTRPAIKSLIRVFCSAPGYSLTTSVNAAQTAKSTFRLPRD